MMSALNTLAAKDCLNRLVGRLADFPELAVAVSGGMDSLMLGVVAHRHHGDVTMFHAASPAVPTDAADRVRRLAAREGWRLEIVDAGELQSTKYVNNPVDRCYHCKSALYRAISTRTQAIIASGTNLDDLDDYRPGLAAATESGAVHPYVDAGIAKGDIRKLARHLGLTELGSLPASPCLASRVMTGIPISAAVLRSIGEAEMLVRERTKGETVRCRVNHGNITVELDPHTLSRLVPPESDELGRCVAAIFGPHVLPSSIAFAPYRRGSAFLR